MSAETDKIAVVGAGSWGTALAIQLARNEHEVKLWGHQPNHLAEIEAARENQQYLPGIALPPSLTTEANLATAIAGSAMVLVVVPSSVFRPVLQQLKPHLADNTPLAWATKGVEKGSHKLLHQVVEEEFGADYPKALLSGPTFATEVARGLPTAITIASDNSEVAHTVAELFHSKTFRCYTSSDLPGVQIGGTTKNILAIAAGIADGLGFGANTRAAVMTRGLHEQMKLGTRLGGQQETFMGLSGLGDLVLTCTDDQSRNRRMGLAVGNGATIEQALESIGQVVEGLDAARDVSQMARELGIEMPITEQVAQVLHHGKAPKEAVRDLLQRDRKPEQLT